MTLHEAIQQLLTIKGHSMTTTEIANELNRNGWYQKRDGSSISAYQIHGRTRNYSDLFIRDGATVSLKSNHGFTVKDHQRPPVGKRLVHADFSGNLGLLEKVLMNENNFKSAGSCDKLIPDDQGLYCIRIKEINELPAPFDSLAQERQHNIIYIGIANTSLRKRLLNQELRAKGHGTFFRSMGAVLGFRPESGSLCDKANKRNYIFNHDNEKMIIQWINQHLLVNWVAFDGDTVSLETSLLRKYQPLFNLAKNPGALPELIELRRDCVRVANESRT